jgi:hypothetical protein
MADEESNATEEDPMTSLDDADLQPMEIGETGGEAISAKRLCSCTRIIKVLGLVLLIVLSSGAAALVTQRFMGEQVLGSQEQELLALMHRYNLKHKDLQKMVAATETTTMQKNTVNAPKVNNQDTNAKTKLSTAMESEASPAFANNTAHSTDTVTQLEDRLRFANDRIATLVKTLASNTLTKSIY